jgi:cell fate (sporulation/competence/biofilm development) regulator YlbF (YheA/YmcA/DUF963 family)
MDVKEALEQFLRAFRESEAFRDYAYQKQRVKEIPGLADRINEFRRKRMEFQYYNGDDLFEKVDEFEREYSSFEEEPVVREYLAAELEICRQVQEINTAIAGLVDIDMLQ